MSWTEDRITRLTALWKAGVSASGIARDLGEVSRSAVLGKLQRLGLLKSRRAASAPRRLGVDDAGSPEAQPAAACLGRRTRTRREPPPSPWKASAFRPLAGTTPRGWLTRAKGECAFPVAGKGMATKSCCAAVRAGGAYCPTHHAIMFKVVVTAEQRAVTPAPLRHAA